MLNNLAVINAEDIESNHRLWSETHIAGMEGNTVNSTGSLYEFALRGLGVTAIPENLACRGFNRGELLHVLPDRSLRPMGPHAVWPGQTRRENLTLLFVRFLATSGKVNGK